MRKTRRNRTPKDERDEASPLKYITTFTKSRSGVKYEKYTLVLPTNPSGFNYETRKRLDAIDQRQKEGREYYITDAKGKRMYAKET